MSNHITLSLTTEREYRLLKQLLKKPTLRRDLDRIVGTTNVPDLIMRVREAGLYIHCKSVLMRDRDGKFTRPGIYWLDQLHVKVAREAVKSWKKKKGADTPSFRKRNK